MDNLDSLLQQPLPEIEDNGFTVQTMQRIKSYQRAKNRIIASIVVLFAAIFALTLPLGQWFSNLTQVFSFSIPSAPSPVISDSLVQAISSPALATIVCTFAILLGFIFSDNR
ncbi:hypothetical protein [Thalassotalea agarivorans]|uniref:Uncharacterized protein n=1 Tax=Thalassotalea agarivorans TaxID=349064 RepID=A0A1I0H1V5_THASX|nr:hypothetical protein [Thalassotalea agarivorans]SET77498.1 hypothetical protein SAMN05660429_02646 [Thalassotalea agarivorans]